MSTIGSCLSSRPCWQGLSSKHVHEAVVQANLAHPNTQAGSLMAKKVLCNNGKFQAVGVRFARMLAAVWYMMVCRLLQ